MITANESEKLNLKWLFIWAAILKQIFSVDFKYDTVLFFIFFFLFVSILLKQFILNALIMSTNVQNEIEFD